MSFCSPLALAVMAFSVVAVSARGTWTHGWDSALEGQFIDYGYQALDDAQAAFAVSKYRIISLEKCTGPGPTEANIYATAALLKSKDPSVKVLFYWATDQQGIWCYAAAQTLLANPSWWLRDDAGHVVNVTQGSTSYPRIDYTVAAARSWWASVPLGSAGAAAVIDGVLADGTGGRCPAPGIAPARCEVLVAAKSAMVRELQSALDAANGGSVLGNGFDLYPDAPPDNNLYTLADMDGILGEHFAVFESVLPNGSLDIDRVALFMRLVGEAAARGKLVVVATWPGLYVSPFTADGWPSWPNGSQPTSLAGWQAALAAKHAFALCLFLTVAEPNVFMSYEGWYNGLVQGAIACPQAPQSCASPPGWYPDLDRPLGAPVGPATRAGNIWTRHFAHATSFLNLDEPDASNVTFF